MKVTLPPAGLVPSFFHAWGVANPNCNEWSVTGIPLAAEDYFKSKGIHLAFNCQKLLPNWIDMITHSGTCDIMFRSKADLEAYRAYDTQWKPFLITRTSGQANLVESKPNEIVFHATPRPLQDLHIQHILYLRGRRLSPPEQESYDHEWLRDLGQWVTPNPPSRLRRRQ